jgi:hypothetical protein
VRSRDGALGRCVQRVVGSTQLPEAPAALDGHLHGTITFDAWRAAKRPAPYVRFSGVLPQLAVRRGELETIGFRANGVAEIAKGRAVRLLAGGALEFAGADTGNPAYRLRALVGVMVPVRFAPRVRLVGLVGAGISDLGTKSPRGHEFALEERLIIPIGNLRLHAVLDYSTRETGYGLGASYQVRSLRLYAGGQYGRVENIPTTMFTFGTAIGDVY